MIVVGLTGGIASGKTTTTNFLIKKLIEVSYLFKKRDIHYSRKPVFYEDSSPPIFKDKI